MTDPALVGVISESEVRRALDAVEDPCSVAAGAPAGIAELGLLSHITIEPGRNGATVRVGIRLTDPVCMMGAAFLASAREALGGLAGVASAEVWLDERADWTPAQMSASYRARLERARAARAARPAPGAGAPPEALRRTDRRVSARRP